MPNPEVPLCSDEDFAKLTGGCLYRGHFPDFKELKKMFEATSGVDYYICPRCLKQTKFDLASGVLTTGG